MSKNITKLPKKKLVTKNSNFKMASDMLLNIIAHFKDEVRINNQTEETERINSELSQLAKKIKDLKKNNTSTIVEL